MREKRRDQKDMGRAGRAEGKVGRGERKSQKSNLDFRESTVAQEGKCGAHFTHAELRLTEMFFHTLLTSSLSGLDS